MSHPQIPAALRGESKGTDHPRPYTVWWEVATCPLRLRRLTEKGKEDWLIADSYIHNGHISGKARWQRQRSPEPSILDLDFSVTHSVSEEMIDPDGFAQSHCWQLGQNKNLGPLTSIQFFPAVTTPSCCQQENMWNGISCQSLNLSAS